MMRVCAKLACLKEGRGNGRLKRWDNVGGRVAERQGV